MVSLQIFSWLSSWELQAEGFLLLFPKHGAMEEISILFVLFFFSPRGNTSSLKILLFVRGNQDVPFFFFSFFARYLGISLFRFVYRDVSWALRSTGLLFSLCPVPFLMRCVWHPFLNWLEFVIIPYLERRLWVLWVCEAFERRIQRVGRKQPGGSPVLRTLTSCLPAPPGFEHPFSFGLWQNRKELLHFSQWFLHGLEMLLLQPPIACLRCYILLQGGFSFCCFSLLEERRPKI